ncbi:MAG: AarF/UbiB family protein [Candidatus Eremiobacterota bacterium]
MQWNAWIDRLDLERLLSQVRPWIPRIRAGLGRFLRGLTESRQRTLCRALEPFLELPAETQLFVLMRECPSLHKLGQVLSRDRRLPEGLRLQLQRLESLPPWTPVTLPPELGPGTPLAEGSLAVVVAAAGGVAKVLKPRAAENLAEELEILPGIGRSLDLPHEQVFDSVGRLLRSEVRLDRERDNLARAGREGLVRVPAVLPAHGEGFFTMERIDAMEVTRAPRGRFSLAHELWSGLVAGPLFAPANRLVHLDPHPGNLRVDERGRLTVLDWSLTLELQPEWREGLTCAALGWRLGHPGLLARGLERLTGRPPEPAWLEPCSSWLEGLDRISPVPPEFLLWRKSLHTLQQVSRELAPELVPEAVLAECCWTAMACEAPWRWLDLAYPGPLSQVSNRALQDLWLRR